MKSRSQRGVALIITLIFISLITILAVAFLALSGRQRTSVSDSERISDANEMSNSGLDRSKAVILGTLRLTTNPFALNFAVSTSLPNSPDLNLDALTNLWRDSRVPVFVDTNRNNTTGPSEFRYYVDINRNGRPETNGYFLHLDTSGQPVPDTNLVYFVGDPEWLGVLRRPDRPHSASNQFFGRYAFVIVPAGKALDLNAIHNHVKTSLNDNVDGFARNTGVGSWEMNYAAFLTELNPNPTYWDRYIYNTNVTTFSQGPGFQDAREFALYRYGGATMNLPLLSGFLGNPGALPFANDNIDELGDGPMDLGWGVPLDDNRPVKRWPGTDSFRHYFTFHELFDTNKCGIPFVDRLQRASAQLDTTNRYLAYRFLDQMATDSATEPMRAEITRLIQRLRPGKLEDYPLGPIGRINLNYDNITPGRTATNLNWWRPETFFNNAANVLLHSQFPFGVTNIPIFPTNFYTPAVHRLLQVTANIYDAAVPTNIPVAGVSSSPAYGPRLLPSVFRPVLTSNGTDVFISGYVEDNRLTLRPEELNPPYGLPLIIGARKHLPNFNEYVMRTAIQATRKLQVTRPNTNAPPNAINPMFILGLSNLFAVELWNSYRQPLPYATRVDIVNVIQVTLTNSDGYMRVDNYPIMLTTNIAANAWPGYAPDYTRNSNSFQVPIFTNIVMFTGAVYRVASKIFDPIGQNYYESNQPPVNPQWGLLISNRLTCIISYNAQIIDYVHLPHLDDAVDISATLMGQDSSGFNQALGEVAEVWRTNLVTGSGYPGFVTEGMVTQLEISRGRIGSADTWQNYVGPPIINDKQKAIDTFNDFFQNNGANLAVQAPFTPSRKILRSASWQANDPLVHYLVEDLKDATNNIEWQFLRPLTAAITNSLNVRMVNERYRPWGGNPGVDVQSDTSAYEIRVKDPGVYKSDDWDFPTNKLANLGWLGRIHRGTPWQTIYLKAGAADATLWEKQSLDPATHPTNDWRLLDTFTTALHPQATRGTLSINQTNRAAWAAALGGVLVLTNLPTDNFDSLTKYPAYFYDNAGMVTFLRTNLAPVDIEPVSPQLDAIVAGINAARGREPGGWFRHLGDILSVPELTTASPFLNQAGDLQKRHEIPDFAYERIPQQVMSLLKVGEPRYVVYAFGQSLKPAVGSIVRAIGGYSQLCTNYQVVGEVYTRAVVRVDGTIGNPRLVTESFNILPTE